MAYTKLAEGNRVWDSSLDLPVYFEDFNEIQDQLKGMMGSLQVSIPVAAGNWYRYAGASLDSQRWDFRADADPVYWERMGAHANPLTIPLGTIRAGQKIISASVVIYGDATGGSIKLMSNLLNASAGTGTSHLTSAANPWNLSAAWGVVSLTGSAFVCSSARSYFIQFTPAATGTMKVLGGYYQIQFGN